MRDARFPAELRQHKGGGVHNLGPLIDAAPDLRGDFVEVPDAVRDLGQERQVDPQAVDRLADGVPVGEGGLHVEQLRRLERVA